MSSAGSSAGLQAGRLDRLRAAMDRADLDAAAIVPGPNFYYLTGAQFHLMERPTILLVPNEGPVRALMPLLERTRWESIAPEADTVYWQDSDGYAEAFRQLATRIAPASIGVEGQRMRVFEAEALRRAFPAADVLDAHSAISHMRLHKDESEIAALRRAVAISEGALAATLAGAAAGMTEAAFRQRLLAEMLDRGADGPSFDPIVLAGPVSADPHGAPSPDRRLEPAQPLLVDFGAAWGGYNADITRTFFVGSASPAHRDIYEAVRAANELGRSIAAPPMTLDELDRRVAQSLGDAGFAELVLTKTGHGLGLDVHEAPQVMIGNMAAMEPGMVFTVEPGLYREGDIGVRIEDDVLVTSDGAVSLTTFDRSLTVIG
jgi:Xaa-Pro aminopeptidase